MTRTLAGLPYRPHSPSLYELEPVTLSGRVALIMDSTRLWHIWTEADGLSPAPQPTLADAAAFVARGLGVNSETLF